MYQKQYKGSRFWRLVAPAILVFACSAAGQPRLSGETADERGAAAPLDARQSAIVGPHRSGISYQGGTGKELGMALGGLGTSTLEIGRNGAFEGVRVQNNWSGAVLPVPTASFLSVHARTSSGRTGGRVLQLDAPQGLAPVKSLVYTGRFPFVQVAYQDAAIPCQVAMEAFSPFVPQDAASSSLPLVFFTFRLKNPHSESVTASVAISWVNDIGAGTPHGGAPAAVRWNSVIRERGPAVLMGTQAKDLAGSEYLLACLPADGVRYSAVSDWWKGPPQGSTEANVRKRSEEATAAWQCFLDRGVLPEERGDESRTARVSGRQPAAAVAGRVELEPGEEKEVRFALV
jgi:hypothetical protein